ncbi:MAG: M3 family oligoendopeptidase [Chloroflexota bacterium]|jgi:pepF/M3 family oligoendopeptidase
MASFSSDSHNRLPRWDVSNVYPSLESSEFEAALTQVTTLLNALQQQFEQHCLAAGRDPIALYQALADYLQQVNQLSALYSTVGAYTRTFVTTDSYNAIAKKTLSQIEMMGVPLRQLNVQFRGWLRSIADVLPAIFAQGGVVAEHSFYLSEEVEESRYMMSEAEESLATELSLSGAMAWNKLQGIVTSQLTVDFERNGKIEKMSMPALINLSHDADGEVRRKAYEAEIAAWKTVQEPLAACMNGIKGAEITLAKKRGRPNPLHAALEASRIDQPTLDVMLGAMRDSFPIFRRYLQAKAKRMGQHALPWWDLFAPIVSNERVYSWQECRTLIEAQFAGFSPRLAVLAKRAFTENWIDAEQRSGKRGGAFCMKLQTVKESRILCNFDGSLDQVSTIAHELGHAFHNECLNEKTPLQAITPVTLAETASIFCETIVTEAALREARSRDEALAILETDLIGKTQVIVDITSRFLFEQEVFARRAKAELLAEDLCDMMVRAQKATYGDGLDARYLHPYMWTWKPHYYYPNLSFYNFPYAFGLLFGIGLYAIYQQRGAAFVPEYEALLASTGDANAADLAARFGINIRDKAFWQASLDVIGERVAKYVNE